MLLAGCAPAGEALRVTLETTANRAETCFVVELRDRSGLVLGESRFARSEDQTSYEVAVVRQNFPTDVTLAARALIGPDCATATKPNGLVTLDTSFVPARIIDVTLSLTGGDDDGDGFVSTLKGGLDCNDADVSISPGERERCFGTVDFDCNGLVACADPACLGMSCGGQPTRLHFVTVPPALRVNECGAVSVELQDANDRTTSPSPNARLVPTGPFAFFSDPQCLTSVTDVALGTTTRFSIRTATPGTATLVVSSRDLMSDTRDITVSASLPAALHFANAPVMAAAGQCSGTLELELLDSAGTPTVSQGPMSIALGADAGGVFGLYVDPGCAQPVTLLQLDAGTGRNTFHFAGQRAGTFTIGATEPTLLGTQQSELITPGPVATVVVTPPPGALTVSACSAAFAVDARDSFGNVVVAQQLSVTADAGVSVFTGVTCATPGTSDRFAVIATEESSFTLTITAGMASTTVPVIVRRPPPPGGTWRWPLSIVTGARNPDGGYQGYTMLAAFDSRSAVDAGLLNAAQSDLRVLFWDGAGWREIDRVIESPNTNNTRVRFASQTDLPAGATDLRYSFFAGPFDGGTALRDPHVVYLFADDFEEGTLGRWNIRAGAWTRATDGAHGGAAALKFGPEGAMDRVIEAKPALAENDVMFEAWWFTSNIGNTDFGQMVRLTPSVTTAWETNLQDTGGWNIAGLNNGGWTQLVGRRGMPTVNTWMRVAVAVSSNEVRVFKDGVQLVPQTGVSPLTPLASGNVGFRKHDLGGSIWVDDVTVRRYTDPEPNVSVGVPFLSP